MVEDTLLKHQIHQVLLAKKYVEGGHLESTAELEIALIDTTINQITDC